MLYYFLVPLAKDHIVFNVFRYLTFRSFMALISALIISLLIAPWLIRRLRALQQGSQTIREDTPERHRTKKGTPTMGGIVILTAIIATTLLWANLRNRRFAHRSVVAMIAVRKTMPPIVGVPFFVRCRSGVSSRIVWLPCCSARSRRMSHGAISSEMISAEIRAMNERNVR